MNRRVVLKIGGSLGTSDVAALTAAIADLRSRGDSPIVVHGGGPRISAALKEHGLSLPFLDGVRVTTDEAMPIIERVLCRDVNPEIVMAIDASGIPAVPLTCRDAVLFASPLPGLKRTATVASVSQELIENVLLANKVPVVAPVAVDNSGNPYNVNADIAASAVAKGLGAERVVFFTDVEGIYSNFEAKELMTFAREGELRSGLSQGRFQGGMVPKVTAVLQALENGVEAAFVVDGRSVESALWAVSSPIWSGRFEDTAKTPLSLGTCVVSARAS